MTRSETIDHPLTIIYVLDFDISVFVCLKAREAFGCAFPLRSKSEIVEQFKTFQNAFQQTVLLITMCIWNGLWTLNKRPLIWQHTRIRNSQEKCSVTKIAEETHIKDFFDTTSTARTIPFRTDNDNSNNKVN